jgi:hypothetical protein
MVPDCQTAARDATGSDCHTIAGIGDVAGSSYAGDTGHGSTDWVAPGFSVENPIEDKHAVGVASRSLPLELPLLGIHLLALIVDYNSTIHEFLEAGIDIGHQLNWRPS